jgi:hypothetical protein
MKASYPGHVPPHPVPPPARPIDSADAGTAATFTHTPCPPNVPASHPNHHYFSRRNGDLDLHIERSERGVVTARVLRYMTKDTAMLQLRTMGVSHDFECNVFLSADQLTELARQLLDAAHDLQTLPASAGDAA